MGKAGAGMIVYLWFFFLFSFLGWCAEVAFAAVRQKKFVNRGFLNGPLCPIYGFGVVLLDFLLRPFGRSFAVLLVGSLVLGSALEWLAGFLLEKLFGQKWWDYSDQPHNLGGYVCLSFSVVWAVAGAVLVRFVLPLVYRLVAPIPHTVSLVALGILGALTLADFLVTVAQIVGLNRKLKYLEYVSDKLRQGSEQLGRDVAAGAEAVHGKRKKWEKDWQKQAARLKKKYEKGLEKDWFLRRLLKAFPDLTSLKHNAELEELRQNLDLLRRRSSQALQRRNEAALAAYESTVPQGEEKPFAFGLCYSKLFAIFVIGNVVGCVLETLYALALPPHQLEMRVGLVLGPFIPVYGLGAVAITLCLYKMYNQKDVLIFLASMFIGGAFEYLCSFLQQAVFGTVSWEYSDSALNIGGRTNLMYAFFWGILGLVWVKDLYPFFSRQIQRIPKKTGRGLTVFLSLFMAADILLSAGAVYRESQRINGVPATNAVQEFFDTYFPDEFLDLIYPHMQYVGKPELPEPQAPPPLPQE